MTRNEQLVEEARAHAALMIHAGDFDAENGAKYIYALATALSECRERNEKLEAFATAAASAEVKLLTALAALAAQPSSEASEQGQGNG